jgi:transposase
MNYIGMDVHKQATQLCVLDAEGTIVLEQRIRTTRARLTDEFRTRPRARLLLEASTESEWVAQVLEGLGHEVLVADPNFAPMYATRSRRVKTDRRDARALAEACRLGAYRPAHRLPGPRRELRATLAVRDALVQTRTRYLSLVRALLRREGIALPSGSASRFARRLAAVDLPPTLADLIRPVVELLAPLEAALAAAEAPITAKLAAEPCAPQLQSVPGVGPLTAATFLATIDTPTRFPNAGRVAAYLGLVPREWSSGEQHLRAGITKAGNRRARAMLVQAAWGVWRDRHAASTDLRQWVDRLAARRGKRVAVVALARRLAGILFALWRDGTTFDAQHVARHATLTAAA